MSGTDLIASSTLAHLYLAQGHRRKARDILAEVLRRDPHDGHALHLRHRLDAIENGELVLRRTHGRLQVQWKRARAPEGCAVVLCALRLGHDGPQRFVTSTSISAAAGTVEFPLPFPRGHATACLGRVVTGHGFVPECVGDPLVWSDESA